MSLFGVFSGDKSSSANSTNTETSTSYADNRLVNDGGSLGVSSGGGAVNLNTFTTTTDGGTLALAGNVIGGGLGLMSNLGRASLGLAGNVAGDSFAMGNNAVGGSLALSNNVAGGSLALANNALGGALAMGNNLALSTLGSLNAATSGANATSLAALNANAHGYDTLMQTADNLFSQQQKVVDISASLAGLLASKASGTQDTGLQTAYSSTSKTWAIAAAVALGAVLLLRGRL